MATRQDVGRTLGEGAGRFGQAAAAHVVHDRVSCTKPECAGQVIPGHARHICHVVERDLLPEVAFDVPERLCGWVHNFSRQHEDSIQTGPIADLIALAVPDKGKFISPAKIVTCSLRPRG
jgi:hypothetical protein